MLTEEVQLAGPVLPLQFFKETPTEQPREHAHRKEEPRPAGDPARAVG
jgi:hypothetical protein